MSVTEWLTNVQQCVTNRDKVQGAKNLGELFNVDVSYDHIAFLQNDIWENHVNIETSVDAFNLYDGEWPGFCELVKTYLKLCKNIDPFDLKGSYDLLAGVLHSLQVAFLNSRGAILTYTTVNITSYLIPMALNFDTEDVNGGESLSMYRLTHLAGSTLKSFNTIRGERMDAKEMQEIVSNSPNAQGAYFGTKKSILLYMASTLCRLYFYLDQLTSCANVFSNIHTADIRFNVYPMSQKVEYRFWLGRYYLIKNQLVNAYCHLYWSFTFCEKTAKFNQRTILIYLIPVSMLLGKTPTESLLRAFDLYDIYWPLVQAMKRPDFTAFKAHLRVNRPWFVSKSLYLLLETKSVIVMLQRLVLTLWKVCGKKDTLTFKAIETALVWAKFPSPPGTDVELLAENICISLISQGFVKGNIFTRSKLVKLRAKDPIPNPVVMYKIEGTDPPDPTGKEKWLIT